MKLQSFIVALFVIVQVTGQDIPCGPVLTCQNGATCISSTPSYECLCVPGYAGTECEMDINECDSFPCLNGGACNDMINFFTCDCTPGNTGTTCSIDIRECDSNPCQNGGACIEGTNRYTCQCLPGFSGDNCECPPGMPIVVCAVSPCSVATCPAFPGATCTDNYCGGCNAIFTDSNGNELDCTTDPRCPDPGNSVGICPICGDCDDDEICCPTGCGTSCIPIPNPSGCPPDRPPVFCLISPCSVATCPAFPGATCTDNYCGGCNAIFTDSNGNEVDCTPDPRCPDPGNSVGICPICGDCDDDEICCPTGCGTSCIPIPNPSGCPPDRPPVFCLISPCSVATCPAFPGATCTDNYCGGCNAIFTDSNGNEVDCTPDPRCPHRRNRPGICPICGDCDDDEICCPTGCGTSCIPISNPSQCPPLVPPNVRVNYRYSCTSGRRIGSYCRIYCRQGAYVEGVRSLFCRRNGRWSESLDETRCVSRSQLSCPSLNSRKFVFSCTDGSNYGSICYIRCRWSFYNRWGTIRCIGGRWNPNPNNFRCGFPTVG